MKEQSGSPIYQLYIIPSDVNKADMFYITAGMLMKKAATTIDLKNGIEPINLLFLHQTIFFSVEITRFVIYQSYHWVACF